MAWRALHAKAAGAGVPAGNENLQSAHCGPFEAPHRPSDPETIRVNLAGALISAALRERTWQDAVI
jgi:hypothetical protein